MAEPASRAPTDRPHSRWVRGTAGELSWRNEPGFSGAVDSVTGCQFAYHSDRDHAWRFLHSLRTACEVSATARAEWWPDLCISDATVGWTGYHSAGTCQSRWTAFWGRPDRGDCWRFNRRRNLWRERTSWTLRHSALAWVCPDRALRTAGRWSINL